MPGLCRSLMANISLAGYKGNVTFARLLLSIRGAPLPNKLPRFIIGMKDVYLKYRQPLPSLLPLMPKTYTPGYDRHFQYPLASVDAHDVITSTAATQLTPVLRLPRPRNVNRNLKIIIHYRSCLKVIKIDLIVYR